MNEMELAQDVKRGDENFDVKRVQEWLTLNRFGLGIDGQFGPATEKAVRAYQTSIGQAPTGVVTPALFAGLVAPMKAAVAPIAPSGRTLGQLTVAYAEQNLAQLPREVGGNNRGPWVRLYMGGREGDDMLWCAGFACFCLRQAAQALATNLPIEPSASCVSLANSAQSKGLFIDGDKAADRKQRLTVGSFFLVRGETRKWKHTGLVRSLDAEAFTTVEGNSNDGGSSNGFEVCSNTRAFINHQGLPLDFIRIA